MAFGGFWDKLNLKLDGFEIIQKDQPQWTFAVCRQVLQLDR